MQCTNSSPQVISASRTQKKKTKTLINKSKTQPTWYSFQDFLFHKHNLSDKLKYNHEWQNPIVDAINYQQFFQKLEELVLKSVLKV